MKKINHLICLFVLGIFVQQTSFAQNTFPSSGAVGIGTVSPNASSLLDVTSTTKGILIPRMTKTQRDAIATPATGLLMYQTNSTPGFYYYSGSSWTAMAAKGPNKFLSNLAAPTAVNIDLLPGVDNTINFGAAANQWKDIYAGGSVFIGGNKFIDGSGSGNTFLGNTTNTSNTGTNNTMTGYAAGLTNTTGSSNSFYGFGSGASNSTGTENTYSGNISGYSNNDGSYNSIFGSSAGITNTASYNSFFGYSAGYSNTTANYNCFFGATAGTNNTTGSENVFVGNQAGQNNTTSGSNTFVGYESGLFNSGNDNSYFGHFSGLNNNIGSANCMFGSLAGYNNQNGNYNSFLGNGAGSSNTSGSSNVFCGYYSGYNTTSGSYNTCVGTNTTSGAGNSNATALGFLAGNTASNQVRIGNSSVTSIGGYANWSNISDGRFKKNIKENVSGLEFINKLQPITYTLDITGINRFLAIADSSIDKGAVSEKEKILYSGFIAQDVEKAANDVGYNFSGVDAPKNEKDLYGLRYAEFVVPLVKSVQELSAENDKLKSDVEELKNEVDQLKVMMNSNELNGSKNSSQISQARLDDITPNPFSQNATISYFIPAGSNNARIVITDASGKNLQNITIMTEGAGQQSIDGNEYASGTYQYSLYINGVNVISKQMMITK